MTELPYGTEGVILRIRKQCDQAFGENSPLAGAWLRAQLARLHVQSLEDLTYRQLLDLQDLVDEAAKGAAERAPAR